MVQFAEIGLVPIRHTGDLQVADAAGGQVLAQLHRHVALDDLAVVQIHLHAQVGRVHVGEDFVRVVLPVQQVAGDVALVDRFDQQLDADRSGLACCPGEVLHEHCAHLGALGAGGHHAGHHVHARAVQLERIRQGLFQQAAPELVAPARQRRDAAFAGLGVAGWGVHQHQGEAVVFQPGGDLGLRVLVR